MQITIAVRERVARTVGTPLIVCGNSDYVLAFDFDQEWDAYPEKKAIFSFCKNGKKERVTVPFAGYACIVPVLNGIDRVEIGCYAGNIRTSSPAFVPCCICITDLLSESESINRDVYNEIMERISLGALPALDDDEYFVITLDGDYVTTSEGDFVIAKE